MSQLDLGEVKQPFLVKTRPWECEGMWFCPCGNTSTYWVELSSFIDFLSLPLYMCTRVTTSTWELSFNPFSTSQHTQMNSMISYCNIASGLSSGYWQIVIISCRSSHACYLGLTSIKSLRPIHLRLMLTSYRIHKFQLKIFCNFSSFSAASSRRIVWVVCLACSDAPRGTFFQKS